MSDNKVILYKADLSPVCRSVQIVAHLIGLELDERNLNLLRGAQFSPEYLKLNPQHTIPTIVDNGRSLWESHAIVCYLVDKYAKTDDLYPKDQYLRAKCNQRLFFDAEILYNRMTQCSKFVYCGGIDIPQEKLDSIVSAYDLLEAMLGDDQFLVGDKFTVADICAITSVTCMDELYFPIDDAKYPRITSWLKRIKAFDFYKEKNGVFVQLYKEFVEKKRNKNRNNDKGRSEHYRNLAS